MGFTRVTAMRLTIGLAFLRGAGSSGGDLEGIDPMLRAVPLALFAALSLAGCKPAGPQPAKPTAGQWELTQRVTDLGQLGGAPHATTRTACLRDADLDFTALSDQANSLCSSSEVSTTPGKVHARVSCKAGTADSSEALIDGTTTADTIKITIDSTEHAGGVARHLKMEMEGHRTGACPATAG